MMLRKSLILLPKIPKSGTRIIAMGLMAMLKREVQDVAFFKPVVSDERENDDDIQFFKNHFKLKQNPHSAYGITLEEVKKLISKNQISTLYEKILERFNQLEAEYDFVLCEGLGARFPTELLDFDLDMQIAKNLQIPVIMILNGSDLNNQAQIEEDINFAMNSMEKHHVEALALFVSRISPDLLQTVREDLQAKVPLLFLPEVEELERPTMVDIMEQTHAKLLSHDISMLDRTVKQSKVAAMKLEHYLNYLEEGDLIIVPGDRSDIIVGTFMANLSHSYPSLAGLLLTGGMSAAESITTLIEGTEIPILPIIGIDTDTQTATLMVQKVSPAITLKSEQKISLAQGLFSDNVNPSLIKERLSLVSPKTMTPIRFTYMLYEKARASQSHILLPESDDERILRAVDIVSRRGLCEITLLGDPKKIAQQSSLLGLDLSKIHIVNPASWEHMEIFVESFYQLRKHKGIIKAMAHEIVSRTNYFATMMVALGYVDGMVSGATHTTRETIKPAFEIIKMQEGVKLISSVFFMLLNNHVLVYGDCAVNPDPNAQELAQIALSSAQTALSFGIEPRIAMLSYSSGDSGVGADVEKVRQATQIAKALSPDLLIEGPMQYDAAVDAKVAAQKMPNSQVAGKATVFIFPELNTGNNTYKAVQRSANAIAIGPILQGLKKPVNDLSRGCLVEDIVHTIAITAIQAGEVKQKK